MRESDLWERMEQQREQTEQQAHEQSLQRKRKITENKLLSIINDQSQAIKIMREALEFYADKEGIHWVALTEEDIPDRCTVMLHEASGGEEARLALRKVEEVLNGTNNT